MFTWGCSDNGSLGRAGDEYTPLLVQVRDAMKDNERAIIMSKYTAEQIGVLVSNILSSMHRVRDSTAVTVLYLT